MVTKYWKLFSEFSSKGIVLPVGFRLNFTKSSNSTFNSAQDGWTNRGNTLSTHQSDGDIYTKHHEDGSWTGMLDEIVKDLS